MLADFRSAAIYADKSDEARQWARDARANGRDDVAEIYDDLAQDYAHLESRALRGSLRCPAPGAMA